MSTLKFGPCPLCPKGSGDKRLYGIGVCAFHLNNPAQDQSRERIVKEKTGLHEDQLLRKFFQEQALLMPAYCENQCGHRLPVPGVADDWKVKASICHIVPKRVFRSVMVHPLNRWFGCENCHHDYDDKGWTHAVTMKVWPKVVDRFQQFMKLITDTEMTQLPDVFRQYLRPIY